MPTSSSSCNGPWCQNLGELRKSVRTTPITYKPALGKLADKTTTTLTSHKYLHVWEVGSDLDDLLHLIYLMNKVQTRSTFIPQENGSGKCINDCTVLVVQDNPLRDNFKRIRKLMDYLTLQTAKSRFDGAVLQYSCVAVVQGVDPCRGTLANGTYAGDALKVAKEAVERINAAIQNMSAAAQKTQLVWHNGPAIQFLNFFLSHTTKHIRESFVGVTLTSTMLIGPEEIRPSECGKKNKITDLERLTRNLKKLDISCTFLDPQSHLLVTGFPNAYIYWWGYYYQALLPSDLYLPHISSAMDFLVLTCYRLYGGSIGASKKLSEEEIAKLAQNHLNYDKVQPFAKDCVNPANYTPSLCSSAGALPTLDAAYLLADSPLLAFSGGSVDAFSRLPVGPGTDTQTKHHLAIPIEIDFKDLKIRISATSPYRLYIPRDSEDSEKVAKRLRLNFMPAIEWVLARHGGQSAKIKPSVANAVRAAWEEVKGACRWALGKCYEELPEGYMKTRAEQIKKMLETGTWDSHIHRPEIFVGTPVPEGEEA